MQNSVDFIVKRDDFYDLSQYNNEYNIFNNKLDPKTRPSIIMCK